MSKEYWDGKSIHYCVDVYQSSPTATMACKRILSTWRNPDLPEDHAYKKYPEPACSVGYSFSPEEVDCVDCRVWIEENCRSCKTCGIKCAYNTCGKCVQKEIQDAGGLEKWKQKLIDSVLK